MKQSGHLNPSEETGTGCPVTSNYRRTPPSKHGGVGRQQQHMIYLDFSKAFDKVDHGVLLHKLKDLGITGKLGIWFFPFLTNRTHYVRIPGGISKDSPVLSGVSQGTVL